MDTSVEVITTRESQQRAEPGQPQRRALLSPAQRRLWVLAQLPGGSEAYNVPLLYRLRGPVDHGALARAFDELAARHEALRTRFVSEDGEVYMRIDPSGPGFSFVVMDFQDAGASGTEHHVEPEVRLDGVLQEEAFAPFDLAEGPLARARLLVTGPDQAILQITVHHIIFDVVSRNLMLRELGALYTAFLRGEASPLPAAGRYSDFAQWQREWLAGPENAAQEAYWKQTLAGLPLLLELPTDRPRPAEQDYRGGRVPVRIDGSLGRALHDLADRSGVSYFATLMAGWAIVLSRMTGQTDFAIGTPSANRRRGNAQDVFGFFVNTVALRMDLSGLPTVQELLSRVSSTVRGALHNVELPFERVVEAVNPVRSPSTTPLVQTALGWGTTMKGLLDMPRVEVEPLVLTFARARFDLVLMLTEEADNVVGAVEYGVALFDRGTAERFARYLVRVLEQMAEQPERQIADLALMDDDEQRALLADWSGVGRDVQATAVTAGLVERFEAQVRSNPAGTAVVAGTSTLDYAGLDRRANRLASALIRRGVKADDVVGLHCGRSVDLVVGVLGILKAGAAYLPLDPGQPEARLGAMVEDARPALVLSDADRPPLDGRALSAVEDEAEHDGSPGIGSDPSSLAYVIYTSGSTGRPKGVAVAHASVLNLLDQWLDRFGAFPGEAASGWSSIGFDASVHEFLMPLTTGAALHLVPDELRGDPAALTAWMREHRIVQAFLPPSYVRWIDEDSAARLAGLSLRSLLTGVESLPEAALHRMRQALPGLRICFGYGPTEATLYSTAYLDPKPLDRQCPIGRPLPNTRLYLLDERMRPVPPGVVGEIYLGGACLARGYLHRPDLTDERFLPDPFVPGERVYRTGDLARWLPDGNAEYVGRRDDQVKLRGFRIEPGEVEAALLRLPGVREAAVLADRDAAGELRLVAGIGRGDAAPRPAHAWRAELSRLLPDYMIPAVFAEFPRLPLSRSGKLDRAMLLEQASSAPARVNAESPRDHAEMALYRIWRSLLVHPVIGVSDGFFDLGGTSISAIKLAHAVEREFAVRLPVRDIILHPTIEALAERLRRGAGDQSPGSLIEFRAGAGRARAVCVHPAGGTAFCYLPLSTALPGQAGVYGIQSPGINAGEQPLPTVEAMAREYLEFIAPRPDEALVLCGLSFGGLIAYEMGRLLSERGHTRVSVVMLDSRTGEDPALSAAIGPVDRDEFRAKLVRFNGMYPGIDDGQIDRYFRIYNHNRVTAGDYRAAATGARLVYVQADHGETDGPEAHAFWLARAKGEFVLEKAGCEHWHLLERPHLEQVAAVITSELALLDGADVPGPQQAGLPAGERA